MLRGLVEHTVVMIGQVEVHYFYVTEFSGCVLTVT